LPVQKAFGLFEERDGPLLEGMAREKRLLGIIPMLTRLSAVLNGSRSTLRSDVPMKRRYIAYCKSI